MSGTLRSQLRAVISDAYYNARNAGRTMEQAADDAAEACERVVTEWKVAHVPPIPPVVQRTTEDVPLAIEWEDGETTTHYYSAGVAHYLTARYTREAKDQGKVSLVITREGSTT